MYKQESVKEMVYVSGVFDLFHYGHMNFLKQCRQHGPVLVALNTDEFAAKYKRRPILTLQERIRSIAGCKYVDDWIQNIGCADSKVTMDFYGTNKIKYIAHGDDWVGESLFKQMGLTQDWLDERGIEMLYVPYCEQISTTEIMARIRDALYGNSDGTRRCERIAEDSELVQASVSTTG